MSAFRPNQRSTAKLSGCATFRRHSGAPQLLLLMHLQKEKKEKKTHQGKDRKRCILSRGVLASPPPADPISAGPVPAGVVPHLTPSQPPRSRWPPSHRGQPRPATGRLRTASTAKVYRRPHPSGATRTDRVRCGGLSRAPTGRIDPSSRRPPRERRRGGRR